MSVKKALAVLAMSVVALPMAQAAKPKFCIYDPLGTAGEGYRAAKDYVVAMQKVGFDIDIKSYLDERVAVEDFRTGQCDGVMATALRTRPFNPMAASMDTVGAATIVRKGKIDFDGSMEVVRRFIQTLSSPKAASIMREGNYEVVGIIPLGAVYPFVNDRAIDTLEKAAGKRVAAFDYDKAQAQLIQRVGARPVSVDVTNFSAMFNNNNVDVIMAPSIVYKPLELHKGIGTKGGVGRFPLTIITYQMVIRADRFPASYGQKSRDYVFDNFDYRAGSGQARRQGHPREAVDRSHASGQRALRDHHARRPHRDGREGPVRQEGPQADQEDPLQRLPRSLRLHPAHRNLVS